MLRKTMIALFAVASVAMLAPDAASARGGGGGHGGGGWGGGGGGRGGGGWSGGGMHSSGIGGGSFRSAAVGGSFRSAAVAGPGFNHGFNNHGFNHGFHRFHGRNFVFGAFAGPYANYDDPYYDYAYDDSDYGDGGCYIVRQRVHTRYGWRIRPVQVCG
jgi:hypothetical protein